jgi:hypothetical protein
MRNLLWMAHVSHRTMSRHPASRTGAALTIALVILTSLLLLGVPFLVLQQASTGGSQAYADHARARLGLTTAEGLAVAVAEMAVAGGTSNSAVDPNIFGTVDLTVGGLYDRSTSTSTSTSPPRSWDTLLWAVRPSMSGSSSHPAVTPGLASYGASTVTETVLSSITLDSESGFGTADSSTADVVVRPDTRREQIQLDLTTLRAASDTAFPDDNTILGAQITDLSGRLDPNSMSVVVWDGLLRAALGRRAYDAAGITGYVDADWDDDGFWVYTGPAGPATVAFVTVADTDDSVDHNVQLTGGIAISDTNPSLGTRNDTPQRNLGTPEYGNAVNHDNDDPDRYGELARALSEFRATIGGRRITSLDQLLRADPGHNRAEDLGGYVYGTSQTPSPVQPNNRDGPAGYGFRKPLTAEELDRLRPYLTLDTTPQGRDGGVTDLGTVVATHDDQVVIDGDLREIIASGSWFRWGQSAGLAISTGAMRTNPRSALKQPGAGPSPQDNDPLLLEQPATVNLLTASDVVRSAMAHGHIGRPEDHSSMHSDLPNPIRAWPQIRTKAVNELKTSLTPPTTIAEDVDLDEPGLPWRWTDTWDPHRVVRDQSVGAGNIFEVFTAERMLMPPADLRGYGLYAITTTARPSRPEAASQARHSRVLQIVPQENLLERRWTTQWDLHALCVQRAASRCTTGPVALERLRPYTRLDNQSTPTPAGAVKLIPDTVFSEGAGYIQARPLPNHATGYNDAYTSGGKTSALIGHDFSGSQRFGHLAPTTLEDLAGVIGEGSPADESLWNELRDTISPDGVLTKDSGIQIRHGAGVNDNNSLKPLHLSVWVKPEPTSSGSVTRPFFAVGDASFNTTTRLPPAITVFYDEATESIIADIAPPAAIDSTSTHIYVGSLLYQFGAPPLGNDADPQAIRTMSGFRIPPSLGSWTNHVGAGWNGVTTRCLFRIGQLEERWYHIHLVVAGRRPEQVHMLIDGSSGRDLASDALWGTELSQYGDTITLPRLRLGTPLPGPPSSIANTGFALLPSTMTLEAPLGLVPEDLLPSTGDLVIGNEAVSYDSLSGLRIVARGVRGSPTTSEDAAESAAWPTFEPHEAGSPILPGGGSAGITTPASGGQSLDVTSDIASSLTDPEYTISISGSTSGTAFGTLTLGTALPCLRGILRTTSTTTTTYWRFSLMGGTVDLRQIGTPWLDGAWDPESAAQVTLTPNTSIDMELIGLPLASSSSPLVFSSGVPLVQIRNPNNEQIEWINASLAKDTSSDNTGDYLIIQNWWDRGNGETGTPAIDWNSSCEITPVFVGGSNLLSDDLVTWTPLSGSIEPFTARVTYRQRSRLPDISSGNDAKVRDGYYFALDKPLPSTWSIGTEARINAGGAWDASGFLPGGRGHMTCGPNIVVDGLAIGTNPPQPITITAVYPDVVPGVPGFSVTPISNPKSSAWTGSNFLISLAPPNGTSIPTKACIVRVGATTWVMRPLVTGLLDSNRNESPPGGAAGEWRVLCLPRVLDGDITSTSLGLSTSLTVLPYGPVTMVTAYQTDPGTDWFTMAEISGPNITIESNGSAASLARPAVAFDAPFALAVQDNVSTGLTRSVISLSGNRNRAVDVPGIPTPTNITEWVSPTWLRGQYGTDRALNPTTPGTVLIGWWPRYAPPQSSNPSNAELRSRTRSWMGFPFRLRGLMPPADLNDMLEITAMPAGLTLTGRLLAFGSDWEAVSAFPYGSPVDQDIMNDVLKAENQAQAATDGIELRLDWADSTQATSTNIFQTMARQGGRTPQVTSVRIRGRAPTQVITTLP